MIKGRLLLSEDIEGGNGLGVAIAVLEVLEGITPLHSECRYIHHLYDNKS